MARIGGNAGLFKPAIEWLANGLARSTKTAGRKAAAVFKGGAGRLRNGLRNARAEARPFEKRLRTDDPIDIASGEVVLQLVDVSLPGVLPLVLERTHVSSYRDGQMFGPTWASTLDQRVDVDATGASYAAEDGMVLSYPLAYGTPVLPVEGPRRPLTLTSAGCTISDPRTGRTLEFTAVDDGPQPLTAISDRNGNRIELHYADGILTEVNHSGGYRVRVDTEDGRVVALRSPVENDSAGGAALLRYAYDEAGRLVATYDPAGAVSRYEYDGEGRLTRWVDRNGYSYEYVYDEQGRAVAGREPNGFLNVSLSFQDGETVVTDALGHPTRYVFNDLGQPIEEVDPLGGRTRSEWDRHDLLLSRTDALGNTTRYEWDEVGNLTAIEYPDGGRAIAAYNELRLPVDFTEPDGAVWRHAYDERGNLVEVTDPLGATTRYAYDERGGLRSCTDALGHRALVTTNTAGLPVEVVDPLGGTTRYTRDHLGRVNSITDPLGGITRINWNFHGKPSDRTHPDGTAEHWAYDAEGNLIGYADAAGNVTRYEITSFDTRSAEIRPDGTRLEFGYDAQLRLASVTDGRGLVWRYEHDPAGNLVREVDFDGRELRYAYDAVGRLVERVNGAGRTRFTRDPVGNVIRRTSGESTATFAYDRAGRLIRAVNAAADVRFDYDAAGQLVAEVRDGHTLSSAYDALGRRVLRRTPSGAEAVVSFDPAGRPVSLRTGGQELTFTRDIAGREVRRRVGTGVAIDQEWDAVHRLVTQSVWGAPLPDARPGLLQHRVYDYRADGVLLGVADQTMGARRYQLDRAGRVTGVTAEGWSERYAYDPAGDLTDAVTPALLDTDGEREHTGTLVRRAGNVRYEYDAQGRVVLRQHHRLSEGPRNWRYTWDSDDRLVGVTTPDGTRWRYAYDALGRRVRKQRLAADGHTVTEQAEFTWDDTVLAEERHTVGPETQVTTWDYEPGSHRPLTQTERVPLRDAPQEWIDRAFHVIVTDLIGAPAELVDPSGHLAWRSRTTLWGGVVEVDGDVRCPLRFPGQYHDDETGDVYNLHRYYDPATARYRSPDPLGLLPGPNPYAYATNPTSETDPLGLANYKRKASSAEPKLSSQNPVPRRFNTEYEKIKAMRAAERRQAAGEQNVAPFPLGRPTPRGGWGAAQTSVEDRKTNRFWKGWVGAREWEVPTGDGTAGKWRIVERDDGLMGYSTDHLKNIKTFPAPWYPDGGKP